MEMLNIKPVIAQYFFIADERERTWDVKFRDDISFDKLTRLYIAFAVIKDGKLDYANKTNKPTDQKRIALLVEACKKVNCSAEIFITSSTEGQQYIDAAKNPTAFANSVVKFLRDNELDGYDMDWENGLDKDALNKLLIALRNAFDAACKTDGKTYGLTLAVWPTPRNRYDLKTVSENVDAINIMSYGVSEPLETDAQAYTRDGFPLSKMIGGVDTEADYNGGVDTLGNDGTIAQKARYTLANGLAGMMAWRMDNDYVDDKISTYKGTIQLYESMSNQIPGMVGPSGGAGGCPRILPIPDNASVTGVQIWSGGWIDKITLFYTCPDNTRGSVPMGGSDGKDRNLFDLQKGETITSLSGTYGRDKRPYVNSLRITTSLNRQYGPWGTEPGPAEFTYNIPPGTQLAGLFGRSGDYVDALGVILRPE
jgi:hypothetical protein